MRRQRRVSRLLWLLPCACAPSLSLSLSLFLLTPSKTGLDRLFNLVYLAKRVHRRLLSTHPKPQPQPHPEPTQPSTPTPKPLIPRAAEEQLAAAGAPDPPPAGLYYMKQTIGNACGTIAMLHSFGNNLGTIRLGVCVRAGGRHVRCRAQC